MPKADSQTIRKTDGKAMTSPTPPEKKEPEENRFDRALTAILNAQIMPRTTTGQIYTDYMVRLTTREYEAICLALDAAKQEYNRLPSREYTEQFHPIPIVSPNDRSKP